MIALRDRKTLVVVILGIAAGLVFAFGTMGQTTPPGPTTPPPTTYLQNLYLWFLGFVGIAALSAIVIGGVLYMVSGTNLTKVEQAKKLIWNAIWGIVIAAASYLLLNTISPDLVQGFDFSIVIQNALTEAGLSP